MSNDAEFEKFVQDLKDKADLVEIIEATSEYRFDTGRHGRFVKCKKPDSLMVDPDWGVYTWFAKSGTKGQFETGDVFHWLKRYDNKDFTQACEYLADKYNVRMPERKHVDPEKAKAQKTRQETFELACSWFEAQLWNAPAALDYCRGRGWTDETIRKARLGFAPGTAQINDLRGEMTMNEVNLNDPATVSIVGKRGGVADWLRVMAVEDYSADWVENNYVPGLATGLRLVYPHVWRGRVVYFSARNLELADGALVNRPEKDEHGNYRPKSYNLPRSLAGERVRYYNFAFTRGADICLVLEGQPDAISAAQLGVPAVGLCGVGVDKELAEQIKNFKIKRVFVGLDNDKVGQENQVKAAALFGPMTRLVTWPNEAAQEQAPEPTEQAEEQAPEPRE